MMTGGQHNLYLKELLNEVPFTLLQGSLDVEIESVTYDSRKVTPGCLFVALSGSRSDGHDYANQAARAGAAAIVAEHSIELPSDVTCVIAGDSRAALAMISAAWFDYPARKLTTVGITGTKGKTTTSFMVRDILQRAGHKTGLIGTNGAYIGDEHIPTVNTTPESWEIQSLLDKMAESGCEYAVMEVSSQGIMKHRVDGILFDYGIFLNISPDHIGEGEHRNFEEYLKYKSQLLCRCRRCVVNHDDEHYDQVVEHASAEIITYGMKEPSDWMADHVDYLRGDGFLGIEFHISGAEDFSVRVNLPGLFNAGNALAAAVLCETAGCGKTAVCEALSHTHVNGRMELVYASESLSALVDYAHNAVSLESLLLTLRDYHPGRLVCVFGCGGNRSRLRRYEMGEISGRLADLSILTADNSRWEKTEDIIADIREGMSKTDGEYLEIPDRREAIRFSIEHAREGDLIAIVGKGHEDYQEICGVRTHFLDRDELESALREFGYIK